MHTADRANHAWTGALLPLQPATRKPLHSGQAIAIPESRFASIASQNERLPAHLGDVPGLLLQAAADGIGRPVLMPLWTEEGMHRAYATLRLLGRRAERERGRTKTEFTAGVECALARSLASAYRSLAMADEDAVVPCSMLLRDVVRNLGALLGGGNGVIVRTVVERLSLPPYKRRALVLCASELMINALTHAFPDGAQDGRIVVSLRLLDDRRACLRVADNGAGFGSRRPDPAVSVAGGLAGLVEADLTYHRTADCTTVAEVVFPVATAPRTRTARRIDLTADRA
jgi:two-component sensor histidine kinase